jgi:hypothetical protein
MVIFSNFKIEHNRFGRLEGVFERYWTWGF